MHRRSSRKSATRKEVPPPPTQPERPINAVLTRPPVFDSIFRDLGPGDLVRVGRTCRRARDAVIIFSQSAYNINRHLSRFFADPIGFRSLQARTATLISGSNALQFLDRTFYPESDLDLYVNPGHAREVGEWLLKNEGYTFAPSGWQEQPGQFENQDWSRRTLATPWLAQRMTVHDLPNLSVGHYRISGLAGIYNFIKTQEDGRELKVQVIDCEECPLQCILGFHSTCVMNFIAFDAAYCLYPKATFDERRALSFSSLTEHDLKALGKYAVRGWSLLANIWPHETKTSRASFYLERKRWVKDNLSWVVPLDTTGVQPRPRVSLLSERFPWDPVVCNSWILSKLLPSYSHKASVHYTMLKTTVFRYAYVIADANLIQSMMDFIQEQGALEHQKAHHFPESRNADSWTWWDASLPGFINAYLGEAQDKYAMDTT